MEKHTIYLGADYRGFEKKAELKAILEKCHPGMVEVEDLGYFEFVQDNDFNEPAKAVAKAVANNPLGVGVLLCGSGHGVCIQANRIKGARAVRVRDAEDAVSGREHDWANIVCMPADELSTDTMEEIVKAFCHARYMDDERHNRRMAKLEED